jgi:hypothetical protein
MGWVGSSSEREYRIITTLIFGTRATLVPPDFPDVAISVDPLFPA